MTAPVAPPYLPQDLADIWLAAYIDAGGNESPVTAADYALRVMRGIEQPPPSLGTSQGAIANLYDQYFEGNRRADGTFRFDELGYVVEVDAMADSFRTFGVDPELFRGRFGELIGGDVSAAELEGRLQLGYDEIINRAPEIAEYYAATYGLAGLEPEDVFAAFVDPTVGEEILAGRARASLIGGTGAQAGFNIVKQFSEELVDRIRSIDQIEEFFGGASNQIPLLRRLAERHFDPNDDFDLRDYAAATLYDDPVQRRRIARLVAAEQASFGTGAGVSRDRTTGSLTGLREQ